MNFDAKDGPHHPMAEPRRLDPDDSSPVTGWDFGGTPEGPVVLAVHDLTANGLWFGDLAEACGPEVRIVATDLRGRTTSTGTPPPASIDTHLADVLAVADRVDAATVTLLGHGTGAVVALSVAAAEPTRVEGIVVLDGPPVIDTDPNVDWVTAAATVDPGIDRIRHTFAHRDALITQAVAMGRLPRSGMTRALRRALDAEVVGSGFGWRARLDATALQADWRHLTAWVPPDLHGAPVTSFRARHGHHIDDPALLLVDLEADLHRVDTTHNGLVWDRDALEVIADTIVQGMTGRSRA